MLCMGEEVTLADNAVLSSSISDRISDPVFIALVASIRVVLVE